MALPTFVPPRPPSIFENAPEVNLREFEMGDGYTAASPKGLNHVRAVWNLTWAALTQEQMDVIWNFIRLDRAGYLPFNYTIPRQTVIGRWTCRKFARRNVGGRLYSVTLTLRQDFSNADA